MDTEIIKIKCPNCNMGLAVKKTPGLESKNITCPVCKQSHPFGEYKLVNAVNFSSKNSAYDDSTKYNYKKENEVTEVNKSINLSIGSLEIPGRKSPCRLKPGRNIIGREANSSSADIMVPCGGEKRMSREHLVIDVKKVPGKGFVHYVSVYKEKLNATFINDERIEYGDCMVLKDGDRIKLPNATIRFEIPDEEKTDF